MLGSLSTPDLSHSRMSEMKIVKNKLMLNIKMMPSQSNDDCLPGMFASISLISWFNTWACGPRNMLLIEKILNFFS